MSRQLMQLLVVVVMVAVGLLSLSIALGPIAEQQGQNNNRLQREKQAEMAIHVGVTEQHVVDTLRRLSVIHHDSIGSDGMRVIVYGRRTVVIENGQLSAIKDAVQGSR